LFVTPAQSPITSDFYLQTSAAAIFRFRVCLNTANHRKSPQFTANQVQMTSMMPQLTANQYKHRKSPQIRSQITTIHRKSGSSDFNDAATDRKSV